MPFAIDLQLYRDDAEEELMTKSILYSLVNGDLTPSDAAQRYDSWIVNNASSRLSTVLERQSPHALTEEEEERGVHRASVAPNPSGDLWFMIEQVGNAALAIPPSHPGQEKLINLLESLEAMPPKTVPQCTGDDLTGQDFPLELYKNMDETLSIRQWFCELAEDISHTAPGMVMIDLEDQRRWRNYQAFLARLILSGLCDCSSFSALASMLSEPHPRPDPGDVGRLAIQASAAAQWILYAGEFIYFCCPGGCKGSAGIEVWTSNHWQVWKEMFGDIIRRDHYDRGAKATAQEAVREMSAQEEKHSNSS